MSLAEQKARIILKAISQGESIQDIKERVSQTEDEWYRFSSKAYQISIKQAKKTVESVSKKPNVSVTTNEQIDQLLGLNEKLVNYACFLPTLSTASELEQATKWAVELPGSEAKIIRLIGKVTMTPRLRILQKRGRFQKLYPFRPFVRLIDAAVLSYFRTNFISCYLTLVPIIEGVILRWMGFDENSEKPDFEQIRKFFKNSYLRQPSPYNILFHDVYSKACDKILNHHFYKPTNNSQSHSNFNRHVASHLLNDGLFGTKENCVRLFLLLDAMTEIFVYELRIQDPRFAIGCDQTDEEIELLVNVMLSNSDSGAEQKLLGSSINDLI